MEKLGIARINMYLNKQQLGCKDDISDSNQFVKNVIAVYCFEQLNIYFGRGELKVRLHGLIFMEWWEKELIVN